MYVTNCLPEESPTKLYKERSGMVGPARLELTTSTSQTWRSSLLSYGPICARTIPDFDFFGKTYTPYITLTF